MAYPHAPLPPASAIQQTCLLVFHRARCPQGHAGPVTSVQLYSLPGGGALLVSTGGDAETRIWEGPGAGKADGVGRWVATAADDQRRREAAAQRRAHGDDGRRGLVRWPLLVVLRTPCTLRAWPLLPTKQQQRCTDILTHR